MALSRADLSRRLTDADSPTELIAILWTWLTTHSPQVGSMPDKFSRIRSSASRTHLTPDEAMQRAKHAAEPVNVHRAVAQALAEIDFAISECKEPSRFFQLQTVPGIEPGDKYLVLYRRQWYTWAVRPPAASQHPSPNVLAPNLHVVPVLADGIRSEMVMPPDDPFLSAEWNQLQNRLQVYLKYPLPLKRTFRATLATAGTAGLSYLPPSHPVSPGAAVLEGIPEADEAEAIREALDAIGEAKGNSLLLFPELFATPRILESIQTRLKELDGQGPIMTIVGLRHRFVGEENLDESSPTAKWVNEAVLLGPHGMELMRHRKITAAGAWLPAKGTYELMTEDIKLGDVLPYIPTAIGGISIAICLDLFAKSFESRMLKQPASLLCVPSLSKTVIPHERQAAAVAEGIWGLLLVCNRWFGDTLPRACGDSAVRSFAALAYRRSVIRFRRQPPTFHFALPQRRTRRPPEGRQVGS